MTTTIYTNKKGQRVYEILENCTAWNMEEIEKKAAKYGWTKEVRTLSNKTYEEVRKEEKEHEEEVAKVYRAEHEARNKRG